MSPTAHEALVSLVFAGVSSRSVRVISPRGTTTVVAFCVCRGEPLHAEGDDVGQALTRLATKVGHAAALARAERRMWEAAS